MATRYVNVDRETAMLLPVDMRDWVEEDDLVHFGIEAVEDLDLRGAASNSRGTGSAQYPPAMMLALLVYSYATGVFSSRRIERNTYVNVAVRYLCADTHPDHDTIAKFRRDNLGLVRESFVQVLGLARELGLICLGTVAIDGTKVLANASKRANVTLEQLQRLRAQDLGQTQALLAEAEKADQTSREEGTKLPRSLAARAERRARLEAAQAVLAARRASARPQVNTTDPDSRMQPPSQPGGGFTQGYNAQAAVETGPARLIVGARIADSPSDHNQMAATAAVIPPALGTPQVIVVDRGYDSHHDMVQTTRQTGARICCPPSHRFNPAGSASGGRRRARQAERAVRHRWTHSVEGQALLRLRRTTIEPVFGMIKAAMGFRRFHLRGLPKVEAEWLLVALAYNLRRIWSTAQLA